MHAFHRARAIKRVGIFLQKTSGEIGGQVEVLNVPPKRSYEIIAEFQARGSSPASMRAKAAEVGADAVIIVIAGGYRSSSAEWASDKSYSDYYTRIIGTAIRYKE